MILCIDSGNSRIKWGVHDAGRWLEVGFVAHADVDRLTSLARRLPQETRVILANVAGDAALASIRQALTPCRPALHEVKSASDAGGVVNLYQVPGRLGVDRWSALIGARGLTSAPCLVLMAGTATTIDTLDGDGRFLGGLILPGLDLMRLSLARDTAQLPFSDGRFERTPRRTADAIQTGCLHAQLGAIERMFRLVAAEPGSLCLLNGGAAAALAPLLECPLREVDNLVLEGLARMRQAG